jgi:ribosomal protein S18 acetylase RimI-like enzyme
LFQAAHINYFHFVIFHMQIRPFSTLDERAVIELWRHCGLTRPWNDSHKDIQRKMTTQPELFFVGELNGKIIATVMAGFDGHRGWVNYLAVDPAHQRAGIGRLLMKHVEDTLCTLGCPKLNLQVRATNRAASQFYERLGYSMDEVVSYGKRLIPDVPAN